MAFWRAERKSTMPVTPAPSALAIQRMMMARQPQLPAGDRAPPCASASASTPAGCWWAISARPTGSTTP
jgi:hypothetical protein